MPKSNETTVYKKSPASMSLFLPTLSKSDPAGAARDVLVRRNAEVRSPTSSPEAVLGICA